MHIIEADNEIWSKTVVNLAVGRAFSVSQCLFPWVCSAGLTEVDSYMWLLIYSFIALYFNDIYQRNLSIKASARIRWSKVTPSRSIVVHGIESAITETNTSHLRPHKTAAGRVETTPRVTISSWRLISQQKRTDPLYSWGPIRQ